VRKTTPSGQTHYFLDLQGDTAVEKDQNGVWLNDYLYNNGALLVQYKNGTTFFFTHDHLGSTRLMTGVSQNIVDSMDYLPYGEQIAGDTGTSHKLTGKERDSETQLDYFGARYYSNGLGRFITPDWSASPVPVPYANLTDPQSLNQYSYVRNLPTTTVDPDGHGAWNWLKCQFGSEAACAAEREERLNTQKKREEESARIEKERAYLLQHMHNVNTSTGEATPLTDAQIYRLQHASQTQIDEYFQLLNEDAEDREARQVPPFNRSAAGGRRVEHNLGT
jgi:RHS repeat-associated protein